MTLVIYEGPNESASFVDDGRTFVAERGAVIDVPSDIAAALPAGWVLQVPVPFQLPNSVVSVISAITAVLASGDATGATDTATLNAALAAGGRVQGKPGQTYYINAPLYVYSSGVLDMTGCTVNQVTGTTVNAIRNKAVDAASTATDGACTASSAVLTSATLAAVAQVGNAIQVVNGGYGSGSGHTSWYGTIQSVNVGLNQITLSCTAQTTIASGATCYLFTTRDHDITIRGGYWSIADLHLGTTVLTQHATCLRRIDRLTVENMAFVQAGPAAYGGDCTLHMGDVTSVSVKNINAPGTGVPGSLVSIYGPAQDVTVTDIYGKSGDDFVEVASTVLDASGHTAAPDVEGSVVGVTFERLYPEGAGGPGTIYSADGANRFVMQGITFRTVKNTVACVDTGFRLLSVNPQGGASPKMDGILLEDIAIIPPSGSPAIELANSGLQSCTVRNVTWTSTNPATVGIIQAAGNGVGANLRIEDVKMVTNPAGTNIGVAFFGSPGSLAIRGIKTNYYVAPATFIAVQFNGGSPVTVSISDVALGSSTSKAFTLVQFAVATTITEGLHLYDIFQNFGTGITIPTAMAALTIRCSNVFFGGASFITSLSPLTLKAVNLDVNTSSAVVALTTANATPVAMSLVNYTQAGAGADTSKDGAQVITLNKASYTTTTP